MAAIVRVKRRIDDDPADSLLFSCKKKKCEDTSQLKHAENNSKQKHLFKFAGTLSEKDGAVTTPVRDAIKKSKLEREYKAHSVNLPQQSRLQQRINTHCSRYKLVAQRRTLQLDDLNGEGDEDVASQIEEQEEVVPNVNGAMFYNDRRRKRDDDGAAGGPVFCLYDVEQEAAAPKKSKTQLEDTDVIACNGIPLVREKLRMESSGAAAAGYVYDIYYLNAPGMDFRALESVLSIEACEEQEFINAEDDDIYREVYDEDDDSNDEDNWRNDYPDQDPKYFEGDGGYGGDEELGGDVACGSDEEWLISNSVQNRLRIGDDDEVDAGLSSDDGNDFAHARYAAKMMSASNHIQFSRETDMNDDT